MFQQNTLEPNKTMISKKIIDIANIISMNFVIFIKTQNHIKGKIIFQIHSHIYIIKQ